MAKKFNYKKWFLVSILIWFVSSVWTFITCGWLFNGIYRIQPVIWRSPEQISSFSSIIGSNLIGLVTAMIIVSVFLLIKKQIPYSKWRRGVVYGALLWLIGPFIFIAALPFFMTIAVEVIAYWLINYLVIYMILGAIIGAFYR